MIKTLLLTDLDNTLIYSHKHAQPDDICIEWLDGKMQGFMTPGAAGMLSSLPAQLLMIPLTSRSIAQYLRIQWPGKAPAQAVCTNGAVLLQSETADAEWAKESRRLIEPCMEDLLKLEKQIQRKNVCLRTRIVDDSYLFASCEDHGSAVSAFSQINAPENIQPELLGRKLYYLPAGLDKGHAADRLRNMYAPETVIAAGDSEMDVPMLAKADIALVPNEHIARMLNGVQAEICPENMPFSEFVLKYAINSCK